MGKKRFQEIREKIGDVERMLKTIIKPLEHKHLNPGPLVEDPVDFYGEPFI